MCQALLVSVHVAINHILFPQVYVLMGKLDKFNKMTVAMIKKYGTGPYSGGS